VILSASNAADETIRYARSRNVTKVVVGKPTHASLWDRLRPSFLDRLVRASGAIDVYVMSGEDSAPDLKQAELVFKRPAVPIAFVAAATSVLIATTISWSRSARGNWPTR